jgi:hypothetical protein
MDIATSPSDVFANWNNSRVEREAGRITMWRFTHKLRERMGGGATGFKIYGLTPKPRTFLKFSLHIVLIPDTLPGHVRLFPPN